MTEAKASTNRNIFKRFRFKNDSNKDRNETSPGSDAEHESAFKGNKDELKDFISAHQNENSSNECIKLSCAKTVKKAENSLNGFEAQLKPSPPLPMVKFDSEGDFSKEPIDGKLFFCQNFAIETQKMLQTSISIAEHQIFLAMFVLFLIKAFLIKGKILGKDSEEMSPTQEDKIIIDPQKLKKYIKKTLKFLFSQIGLLVLVVGYVILGALLFMQIESSYEKEFQMKADQNREEFYESVKISAEAIFNEYLRKNFHTKYTQYRTEEMIFKDSENLKESINIIFSELNNNNNNNNHNGNGNGSHIEAMETTTIGAIFDKPSININQKRCSWCIELDKKKFNRKIKEHLAKMFKENDVLEDKDKNNIMMREEVWNFPNAALYALTIITTIG